MPIEGFTPPSHIKSRPLEMHKVGAKTAGKLPKKSYAVLVSRKTLDLKILEPFRDEKRGKKGYHPQYMLSNSAWRKLANEVEKRELELQASGVTIGGNHGSLIGYIRKEKEKRVQGGEGEPDPSPHLPVDSVTPHLS